MLIKKGNSRLQSCKPLLDTIIYNFYKSIYIHSWYIKTIVCKHYQIGLVLSTMVCLTYPSNPYNGKVCQRQWYKLPVVHITMQ